MARKRMIDPEFWSDEEIGRWSFEARLFYIALWNFADDEGRFKAHDKLLRSQVFPYDESINMENLKIEVSDKIQWYNHNGSVYGFVRNFLKHQSLDRPKPSILPVPPPFDEQSTNNRRTIAPNRKEKNRKEVNISAFHPLWERYPRKVGKKAAIRHFQSSVKTEEDLKNIDIALDHYLASERVYKGFIQNASTWFNNWQDWVDYEEKLCNFCKGKGKYPNKVTGYIVTCGCAAGKRLKGES